MLARITGQVRRSTVYSTEETRTVILQFLPVRTSNAELLKPTVWYTLLQAQGGIFTF